MKARGVVFKIDRVQWSDSKGEYHCQYDYTLCYGSSYSKPFVVVDPEPGIRPGDAVEIDYNPVYNTREHLLVNSIKKLELLCSSIAA